MSRRHNFQRKIERLIAAGELPAGVGLHELHVYHDSWCGINKDRRCNCDPEIKPKARLGLPTPASWRWN